MFEEYILDKLHTLEKSKEESSKQLLELTQKEEEINRDIKRLLEEDDVGRDLFSPRNANHDIKKLIAEKKHLIEDIQVEELQVQAQIEQAAARIEQYQQVLLEYRKKGEAAVLEAEAMMSTPGREDLYRQALENALKTIDKCIGLVYNDKLKCKNELKNLKYYIKAVLSNPEE